MASGKKNGAKKQPKSPALRADIASLPRYVPGARGDARQFWKLSSNENPAPPLPGLLAAVADAAADMNRYPDMYAVELTEAIARKLSVAPEQVVSANGSVAALGHVLSAFCLPGDEVIYPWRSFEAYPITVQVSGATSVRVSLTADARHDLPAMAAAVNDATRAVILCSPNNPTGPALREAEVRDVLADLPPRVLVLLDEAYVEYVRDPDVVDGLSLLGDFPNVMLLRTFSKAYGLAGLRVGYAVGEAGLIAGVRAASTPFGTNALAQRAAVEALRLERQLLDRVSETVAERDRVLAAVRRIGWDVPESEGNFFWLALGRDTDAFVRTANDAGLLVRGFSGEGVRISIGESEANDAVITLLRKLKKG
ncbi:MAG: histidinol-phosphate transaminase [Actinomycetes bacterium]|nr:histidinol-phosphate transaminase [Actinomycetes bacterium]MDX5380733.1 histidinol-phosphate transaminase [Actinomycetes bacterium]MDX5399732.1 histidinol-phosphate transaminase [Actinomycetes bacterium]MDX5450471.1 histidinol-phosphate transaminase [Actinomycetes bacterium]